MTELEQGLLTKEIDKNSASESEMNPKVEKLKYFYKADFFSKLFFNWIGELISVTLSLFSTEISNKSYKAILRISRCPTGQRLSMKTGPQSGIHIKTQTRLLLSGIQSNMPSTVIYLSFRAICCWDDP